MKALQVLLLVAAGALCGVVGQRFFTAHPVQAADQLITNGGCVASVPKEWGSFKGGSAYGLAFEDEEGTIRFLLHPPCGNGAFSGSISAPAVDLRLERK